MTRKLTAEEWKPQGIADLEAVASRVVRSKGNLAVLAGPGAGKTETLAQRASFLLQTGMCPAPRKILAVSYKRDSARIIRERVKLRCPEEASRFHSVTLDGFAKQIVDRFRAGLPSQLRPTLDYQIVFPSAVEVQFYLRNLVVPSEFTEASIHALSGDRFMASHFAAHQLIPEHPPSTAEEFAAQRYIAHLIGNSPSQLTFPLIARLAQAILLTNPQILASLRACYSHVFLDEFQDTTVAQYELLLTAFKDAGTVVTAVGDDKQRIMSFAGAMQDSFERMIADFKADVERPVVNYRAAPRLIEILRVLAEAVEPGGEGMVPPNGKEGEGDCSVLVHANETAEASHLANMIEGWIRGGEPAGEICILTKMRPDTYGKFLADELARRSVNCRIETAENDYLGEDAALDCLNALRVAAADRSPYEYSGLIELLEGLECNGEDDKDGALLVRNQVAAFQERCRAEFSSAGDTFEVARKAIEEALALLGEARYCALHPEYSQGTHLRDTLSKVVACLAASKSRHDSWIGAIDEALGRDVVTITTIHKSKGREYESVVFLGLEDNAFFSFEREPDENTRTFFVAFSRAKQRILFTFSRKRGEKFNKNVTTRSLYLLLQQAGVEMVRLDQ